MTKDILKFSIPLMVKAMQGKTLRLHFHNLTYQIAKGIKIGRSPSYHEIQWLAVIYCFP